jgi:hypothetical protein
MTHDLTHGRNDPLRPARSSEDVSAGAMAGMAFAMLVFLGAMLWAFVTGDRQTASVSAPPAIAGQGAAAPAPSPPWRAM